MSLLNLTMVNCGDQETVEQYAGLVWWTAPASEPTQRTLRPMRSWEATSRLGSLTQGSRTMRSTSAPQRQAGSQQLSRRPLPHRLLHRSSPNLKTNVSLLSILLLKLFYFPP